MVVFRRGEGDVGGVGPDADGPAREKARLDVANTNRVLGIEVRNTQPDKAWFTLPAWILLALVVGSQRRRQSTANARIASVAN